MLSLQDLDYDEINRLAKDMGYPAYRADQIYDMAMRDKDYEEVTNLPKALIAELSAADRARAVEIIEEYRGKDKSVKYLYKLWDGNVIEGIYMPHSYGDTLCVSTQVGCRMGCAFCASGIGGLVRNLTAGEMLGQVLAANRVNGGTPEKRAVTNVVLMGSGEPLDNYDNVVKFLRMVSFDKGINISPRNISLSTVGLADKIRRLADEGITVTLTISLHAPTDDKRDALIPANKKYKIADIISAAKYYFQKTGRRFIFEYSLVEGKNSDEESAKELSRLLKGLPCHVNLIKLNYVKEKGLRGPKDDIIKNFCAVLEKNGISATIRRSMGNDIQGACGQLRRKFLGSRNMANKIFIEGQVIKIVANRYTVAAGDKVYPAFARGRLKLGEDIFVGDKVRLELQKPISAIDLVLPRKNKLIRPYVANIDSVVIVLAKEPEPDLLLADKVLLNCYKEGIAPIICYNKIDLAKTSEVDNVLVGYRPFVPCLNVSSETGQNLEALAEHIQGKLVCFAGQSAVGKTSMLNALSGMTLRTDGLSQRIMRGKNTTRHVEIFEACGGRVVDTCGFSMLETIDMPPEELTYYYPEFIPLQNKCRYKSCTHIAEPDCAVKAALASGEIDKGRYERYTLLYKELKEARDKKYG